MRRQIGLLKSTWRISLLGLLLAGIVPAGWSQAQEKKLTQAVIRNWVIDLLPLSSRPANQQSQCSPKL
jgi:hypothetical protein